MAATVTHFEIYGLAPAALADFYRELFDWTIDRAPGLDYFRVDTGQSANGLRGGITDRPIDALRGWVHYVAVDSVVETIERTVRLGGTVLVNRSAVPKTAWYAVLAD